MRIKTVLALLATTIGGGLALSPVAASAAKKSEPRSNVVLFNDYQIGTLVERPERLEASMHYPYRYKEPSKRRFFGDLVWTSWGGRVAEATGMEYRFGQPWYPIRIRLSHPRECGPYTLYRTGYVIYPTNEKPDELIKAGGDRYVFGGYGCRISLITNHSGRWVAESLGKRWVAEHQGTSFSMDRAGGRGRSFREVRWKGLGTNRAIGRGLTYNAGERVKVALTRLRYCQAAGVIAYQRSRVVLTANGRRYTKSKSYAKLCNRNKPMMIG